MTMPGFSAELSLSRRGAYAAARNFGDATGGSVIPAIPYCGNCDWILDHCAQTGGRPYALCNACLTGSCYGPHTAPPPLGNGYYN